MPPRIGHHRSSYPSYGLQQLLPPLLTISQTGNLTSSFSCWPCRQGDSRAFPPSPSFPLSHHTSGSGDPPLGPSESTLTYIPNSVTVDCNCPETRPARQQRAWCPGSPGCRQTPRAAGRGAPSPQREAWKWKVKRLEAVCRRVAEEGGGKLSQLGKPTASHWELQTHRLPRPHPDPLSE